MCRLAQRIMHIIVGFTFLIEISPLIEDVQFKKGLLKPRHSVEEQIEYMESEGG
jgi:hypothetical protein